MRALCRVHSHSIFWPLWQDTYFKLRIIDYCTSITTSKRYKLVIPTGTHSIHSYDYCLYKLTNGGGLLCNSIVYCWEHFTHLETLALEMKDCMCKSILGVNGLWGRDFYRAIPATTRYLGLYCLIQRPRRSSHCSSKTTSDYKAILT